MLGSLLKEIVQSMQTWKTDVKANMMMMMMMMMMMVMTMAYYVICPSGGSVSVFISSKDHSLLCDNTSLNTKTSQA